LKVVQWPLLAVVAVALIVGVVVGMIITGWLRPSSGASAKFTDQQVADAKKDVCAAALLARQGVAKNMHLKNPDPENPVAQLAVAANARLSLTGGAAYLRGRLEDEPAAPPEVAKAAGAMAGALEHLNVSYLAGQPNSARDQVGHDLDSRIAELGKLCE
jgi:type II secretory pathway pseudopilin PulG